MKILEVLIRFICNLNYGNVSWSLSENIIKINLTVPCFNVNLSIPAYPWLVFDFIQYAVCFFYLLICGFYCWLGY